MIFNERIRNLRAAHHLTQKTVANEIKMAERNYQRLEVDGSTPNIKNLAALADLYNVSVDYLMGRTDKKEVNR